MLGVYLAERYTPSIKSKEALRVLAEVTAYQWGMVTSAQASMYGVTRLDLSRLAADGLLERLAHGVYKDAGSPGDQFEDMRAAWLSTDPKRLAHERMKNLAGDVVFAGPSAARLHSIGDLRDRHYAFIAPTRRQSQRSEMRYRQRALDPRDVTLADGLPALTLEATIADLFNAEADLRHIGDALRDAARKRRLDLAHLQDLLASLAARNGFRVGDSAALLNRLMQIAGLDVDSLARVLARSTSYASLADVANLVGSVDPFGGSATRAVTPRRRYDGAMVDAAAPTRGPLTGPTGRLVVAHRGEMLDVLRRHGVTNPEVFGSTARGDDHEGSDVDVLVDFPPGTSIIDIIGIKHELEDLLGVPVDLIPRSGLKERVRAKAAKDLLPL